LDGTLPQWKFSSLKGGHFGKHNAYSYEHFNFRNACFHFFDLFLVIPGGHPPNITEKYEKKKPA
jgi:hypothetical protein